MRDDEMSRVSFTGDTKELEQKGVVSHLHTVDARHLCNGYIGDADFAPLGFANARSLPIGKSLLNGRAADLYADLSSAQRAMGSKRSAGRGFKSPLFQEKVVDQKGGYSIRFAHSVTPSTNVEGARAVRRHLLLASASS